MPQFNKPNSMDGLLPTLTNGTIVLIKKPLSSVVLCQLHHKLPMKMREVITELRKSLKCNITITNM